MIEEDVRESTNIDTEMKNDNLFLERQYEYAGFWSRLLAFLIDFLLLLIIFDVFYSLFLLFLVKSGQIEKLVRESLDSSSVYNFILFFLLLYLFIYLLFIKFFQSTLGKFILGMKIIPDDNEEEQLNWVKIILRETVGKLASLAILSLGFLMVGFSQNKRALHDMIAKTVVIYKYPKRTILFGLLSLPLGILILFVTIYYLFGRALNEYSDAIKKGIIYRAIDINILEKKSNEPLGVYLSEEHIFLPEYCQYNENNSIITNVSPDSKNIAIFIQKCQDKSKYLCGDLAAGQNKIIEVSREYALSGKTDCLEK